MKYFTIAELTKSETATRLKIDNTPNAEIVAKLTALVECVLDKVRELHGAPIRVTSGYRCAKLNKAVGGVSTSQHTKGEAVDLQGRTDAETKHIYECAKQFGQFDQLLFEKSKTAKWVHLSWKQPIDKNRHQAIDNYNV